MTRHKFSIVFIFFLIVAITFLSCTKSPEEEKVSKVYNKITETVDDFGDALNEADYADLIQKIKSDKKDFKELYLNSNSQNKDSIINNVKDYLFDKLTNEIFTFWYGTPWDFYGQTRVPKTGTIACGYFITHTLADIGFNIPTVKWAQSASEVMIKKLSNNKIKRFSNAPISIVEEYLRKAGKGIYLVGLDCHVGYIVVKVNQMKFVHSNYYQPDLGVMSQDIDSWNPLNDSKYRVIGKLLSDEMIINWILDKPYN